MTDHLPDVELTDAQDARATALERAVIERPASAACLIVYLRDLLREVIEEDNDSFFMGEGWRERADKVLGAAVTTPAAQIPCNLPFERIPQHSADPGFGPIPPKPKIVELRPEPKIPDEQS